MCEHNGTGKDCGSCYQNAVEGPADTPPPTEAEREQRATVYEAEHGR